MEQRRLDRVQIDVSGNVIAITWAERDWLLVRIARVDGFQTITMKLEAAGADRPVELGADERARLRGAFEVWEQHLTDGLAKLLAALVLVAPHR